MTDVDVVPVSITGSAVVGPSVNVFHCADGDINTFLPALRAFYEAIKTVYPTGTQFTFPVSGVVVDEPSSLTTGTWTASSTPSPVVTGTTSTVFAMGVGIRIVWNTDDFIGGRRVRGSTFIVPTINASYDGPGMILDSYLAILNSAATALVAAAPTMCIYTRKTTSHTGSQHPVTSGQAPDRISWLRSRRT